MPCSKVSQSIVSSFHRYHREIRCCCRSSSSAPASPQGLTLSDVVEIKDHVCPAQAVAIGWPDDGGREKRSLTTMPPKAFSCSSILRGTSRQVVSIPKTSTGHHAFGRHQGLPKLAADSGVCMAPMRRGRRQVCRRPPLDGWSLNPRRCLGSDMGRGRSCSVNYLHRTLRWSGFSGQVPSLTSEAGYRP